MENQSIQTKQSRSNNSTDESENPFEHMAVKYSAAQRKQALKYICRGGSLSTASKDFDVSKIRIKQDVKYLFNTIAPNSSETKNLINLQRLVKPMSSQGLHNCIKSLSLKNKTKKQEKVTNRKKNADDSSMTTPISPVLDAVDTIERLVTPISTKKDVLSRIEKLLEYHNIIKNDLVKLFKIVINDKDIHVEQCDGNNGSPRQTVLTKSFDLPDEELHGFAHSVSLNSEFFLNENANKTDSESSQINAFDNDDSANNNNITQGNVSIQQRREALTLVGRGAALKDIRAKYGISQSMLFRDMQRAYSQLSPLGNGIKGGRETLKKAYSRDPNKYTNVIEEMVWENK